MPRFSGDVRICAALGFAALIVLAVHGGETIQVRAQSVATPTPYHEGVPAPVASPHTMEPPLYPLPSPADRASADAMTAGGAAMIRMAQVMDAAAVIMLDSNDRDLVDLGQHWVLDAQALRQQAAWMVLSATAADMTHDPATAHELNVRNLKGNGMAMTAEGQAMADHGRSMMAQVAQLRAAGALSPEFTDQLVAAGTEMIATGEELERDGQRMEETAERLLLLIGQ